MRTLCSVTTRLAAFVAIGICLLLIGYYLLEPIVKALTGRGIVAKVTYRQNVFVSGCKIKCPAFIIEKSFLPEDIAAQKAFNVGTNTTTIAVLVAELGHLYWLDGNNVGVTRYSCCDLRFIANHWLLISEIALNCTYDVQDDMKGLGAVITYDEDESTVKYALKFPQHDSEREIAVVVEVDRRCMANSAKMTDVSSN